MESIALVCQNCKKEFISPKKEFTRQIKRGRNPNHFFCSRSCSVSYSNKVCSDEIKKYRGRSIIQYNRDQLGKEKVDKLTKNINLICSNIRARKYKHTLKVSKEYLIELWKQQDGCCALTRLPLKFTSRTERNTPQTLSLDRIDSSKDYEEGNVQFVCYSINLAKNSFTNDQVLDFLNEIKKSNTLN